MDAVLNVKKIQSYKCKGYLLCKLINFIKFDACKTL